MSKKSLSASLVFIMTITLLFGAVSASAATPSATPAPTVTSVTYDVYDEASLSQALAEPSTTNIRMTNSFAVTSAVYVDRAITIDGNTETLTLNNAANGGNAGALGLGISGNATVRNLTVSTANQTLKDNLVEVFGAGVSATLENVKIQGSKQAGLTILDGANVDLRGNIGLTRNEWGGIEVEAVPGAHLTFSDGATLIYNGGNTPVVWIDKIVESPHDYVTDNAKVLNRPVVNGTQVWWSLTTDTTAPIISAVNLVSSNVDPTRARVGDTVTLTFKTDEQVFKLGNFKINGSNLATFASTDAGDGTWTNVATYVLEDSDPEGQVAFQINVENIAGLYSVTTEATTDGSLVTVTKSPEILSVSIASNNADTTKATVGDTVYLSFTTQEEMFKLGNFKINGSNPTTFNSTDSGDGTWKNVATYVTEESDAAGAMSFQINVKNAAGFYSITTEATTDKSSVEVIKMVAHISGSNILLVGDYAFDLNDAESGYNLNNFIVAAKTAYASDGTYQVYFKLDENWYDIVSDPTMVNPIADVAGINGDGLYTHMNMK